MPPLPEIADAPPGNWVDTRAPRWLQPYLRLSRIDRPIGTWLLLLPGWWSISLAADGFLPGLRLFILFAVGAIVMRGAGCTLNDIIDRRFDALVDRTRNRPLPSGQVKVWQAILWMAVQSLAGFLVLVQFNRFAIGLGVASLVLVAIYPFMKRLTWWPQFFLGLAFNWGALLGYGAASGTLGLDALVLYMAGIFWTLGYDTIYAHQDKEDDALIGVKSTARLFGAETREWLAYFYATATLGILVAGWLGGMGWAFYLLLVPAAAHLAWQVWATDIDDPADCLAKFRANRDFGLLMTLAIILGRLS